MKLFEIIAVLEKLAPPSLQEEYDNSGLQFGNPNRTVKSALLTLDCTEEVVLEAVKKKCDLIIAHHPLLFKGVKSLAGQGTVERTLQLAVEKKVAIYAAHTNLDNVSHGVNGKIAQKLRLKNNRILKTRSGDLSKLVTFCPLGSVEKIQAALFKAGAGEIGNYDQCSFTVGGTGGFRANENTNPFVGEKGKRHRGPCQGGR